MSSRAAGARFDDRVVVVTGAGNGLGRAYAQLIARLGGRVVVNDLGGSAVGEGASSNAADAVVAEIDRDGGTAVADYNSVATASSAAAIINTAITAFGRVDAVINNAGILRDAPIEEVTDTDFAAVVATNLLGSLYVTQAAFPRMREQRYGRLVFTSSSSGAFGNTYQSSYASSKAALLGLSATLALEGAPFGIRANAILPVSRGRMREVHRRVAPPAADRAILEQSDSWPARSPDWVAPMVAYLASEACVETQQIFSAVLGRYARVAIAVGPGWVHDDAAPPSVDDIADHMTQIGTLAEVTTPQSPTDEILAVVRRRTNDV
jgi:NAD(P)-dependent dehydrogenase (short-subunit alcohol dehydrogenase family)